MPNELWVSDFTFVSTWRGFVYVAFVIDTFANRIVGWKASTTQDTQFVLDALEQAIHARRPAEKLIHHSDRGSQYVSIKYTERLADAGLEPSVGSVGDSYDNALAETIIGLFKTEVINRTGAVEVQRSGRMGNPAMGRLVQQGAPACAARIHHTNRSRGELRRSLEVRQNRSLKYELNSLRQNRGGSSWSAHGSKAMTRVSMVGSPTICSTLSS